MSSEMRRWSDLSNEEKADFTRTEPNEARFWSGTSVDSEGKDVYGPENAKRLAEQDGGKTLEMKLSDNNIDMDKSAMSGEDWEEASANYAKGASGDVKCYKGDEMLPDNTYEGTEKDAIDNNKNINSMTEVDNINGSKDKGIYTRNEDEKLEDAQGNKYSEASGAESTKDKSSSQEQSTGQQQDAESSKDTGQSNDDGHDYYNGPGYY